MKLKKTYVAPYLEVEAYTLDTSIAVNCIYKVDLGPDTPGRNEDCSYFDDEWDLNAASGISVASIGATFYNNDPGSCDCYYTTGSEGYFTS